MGNSWLKSHPDMFHCLKIHLPDSPAQTYVGSLTLVLLSLILSPEVLGDEVQGNREIVLSFCLSFSILKTELLAVQDWEIPEILSNCPEENKNITLV